EGVKQRGLIARGRQHWNDSVADISSQRIAAALARALVVHIEKPELALVAHRPAQIAAENILLEVKLADEEVLGIERGVAEVLPKISVEAGRTAFQDGVNVAAAITALGSVIEAGADLEFLDRVGVGNRCEREFAERVIGGGNALNQIVVVIFSAAVDVDSHIAAAQGGSAVQVRRSARRQVEQLLEVARGER